MKEIYLNKNTSKSYSQKCNLDLTSYILHHYYKPNLYNNYNPNNPGYVIQKYSTHSFVRNAINIIPIIVTFGGIAVPNSVITKQYHLM